MNKVDVEKLFQGKVISQDQNQVHIQLQDSRKRLELSIENDVLTLTSSRSWKRLSVKSTTGHSGLPGEVALCK